MSLPVLHLKASSPQNMTIATDPYETTVTLYTFLRSIPSFAEIDLAYQPFVESLHIAPSSGRGALARRPNHRLVQQLESVALDGVFRTSPSIIPALAAHSDTWKRRLGYKAEATSSGAPSSPPPPHRDGGSSKRYSPPLYQQQAPTSSGAPGEESTVRASELRQYMDPYTAFEARHQAGQPHDARPWQQGKYDMDEVEEGAAPLRYGPHSSPLQQHTEDGREPLQYSGSTQAPEEMAEEPAGGVYRSYLSAEVSALTAADGEDRRDDSHQDSSRGGEARGVGGGIDALAYTQRPLPHALHPVLELIAQQVDQSTAASSAATPSADSSLVDQHIQQSISQLTTRLAEAAEGVSAAMRDKEQLEQVWSPYYSRLKTSMNCIEELHDRLGRALSLYQLQRYERETLQQACVAVKMEALSLRLVLRDVRARVSEAVDGTSSSAACTEEEERELMEQLREALRKPDSDAALTDKERERRSE